MKVSYIIPIKTYLAKYLNPKDKQIHYEGVKAVQFSFIYYAGYKIDKKKLLTLYTEKKLFKGIKRNEYPKKFLAKYKTEKYTYLKFNFPVTGIRSENSKQNENYDLWIKLINNELSYVFWADCINSILFNRNTTIDQAIIDFYKFYGLTDIDYKISSFKRMLYKYK